MRTGQLVAHRAGAPRLPVRRAVDLDGDTVAVPRQRTRCQLASAIETLDRTVSRSDPTGSTQLGSPSSLSTWSFQSPSSVANRPFCTMLDPRVVWSGASHTRGPELEVALTRVQRRVGRDLDAWRAGSRSARRTSRGRPRRGPDRPGPRPTSTVPPSEVTTSGRRTGRPARPGTPSAPSKSTLSLLEGQPQSWRRTGRVRSPTVRSARASAPLPVAADEHAVVTTAPGAPRRRAPRPSCAASPASWPSLR